MRILVTLAAAGRASLAVPFAILLAIGVARPVEAQTPGASAVEGSRYDRIWRRALLYENAENSVLQSLRFVGRFQLDYATVDADQGSASEWNVRRMRLGGRAGIFNGFTVHVEADLDPQDRDPTYLRLTDAYLRWSPTESHEVTIGKQGVSFTLDGTTSSKELLTLERSTPSGNLWFSKEYMPGVTLVRDTSPWVYEVGLFSAGGENREFGDFEGGSVWVVSVAHDLSERVGAEEASLAAQYVNQSRDPANSFTRPLGQVVSVNGRYDAGRWGVRADFSMGKGQGGQSDLWGVVAMPFWDVGDRVQIVARWSLVKSGDANGVSLPTYENTAVSGRGDRWQDGYLGANWYLYGHNLKLQSGVQFGEMTDEAGDGGAYSGISWTTGVRIGW